MLHSKLPVEWQVERSLDDLPYMYHRVQYMLKAVCCVFGVQLGLCKMRHQYESVP